MKKQTVAVSCITTYALLVAYLSLSPITQSMPIQIWDKLSHVMMYSGFGFLACFITNNRRYNFLIIFTFFIFGFLIEYLQTFVPSRDFSLADQLANTIGLLVGYLSFLLFNALFKVLTKRFVSK